MHNPIIVDLALGDSGKGTTVDYLATPRSLVIRYGGASQAAHNVVTTDGRHHTFAQFGSGTFNGAATHLSRFMLINPMNMMTEERHLDSLGVHDAFLRTTVDDRAVIITPYHIALNRIMEISRAEGRHGSCGQGVGVARADSLGLYDTGADVLLAGDIQSPGLLYYVLEDTRKRMVEAAMEPFHRFCTGNAAAEAEWALLNDRGSVSTVVEHYERWVRQITFKPDTWIEEKDGDLIFEGAQGVLLDETHGFEPYNTWTDCTPNNALTLLTEAGLVGHVIGVCRTYMTRHGAGPLPTENGPNTEVHQILGGAESHNGLGEYQGAWRTGYLDLPLLRYAIDCCGGDFYGLVVTHLDRVLTNLQVRGSGSYHQGMAVCESYRLDGHHVSEVMPEMIDHYSQVYSEWTDPPAAYAKHMAEDLGIPLVLTSHGPTAADKEEYAVV